MIVVDTVAALRAEVARWRAQKRRVAFVPTLGNLHAGHRRLMQAARAHADAVIASVYVNPLQFGPNEDFSAYPRTLPADSAALGAEGVDLLFIPDDAQMYPRGPAAQTRVEVPGLGDILCGAFRPGHFRGVATVVNRLFNLVQPDAAIFGKKDYQQWLLIRLMASDLGMPIEIVGVETVREADGLAMSSRNGYLSPAEREIAPRLYRALGSLRDGVSRAHVPVDRAEQDAAAELAAAGFRMEYVSVRRALDLQPACPGDRRLVVLAAAWLGRTRLIDNIEFDLP